MKKKGSEEKNINENSTFKCIKSLLKTNMWYLQAIRRDDYWWKNSLIYVIHVFQENFNFFITVIDCVHNSVQFSPVDCFLYFVRTKSTANI